MPSFAQVKLARASSEIPTTWSERYYSKIDLAAFVLITVVPLVIEEGYYNPGRGQAYVIDLPRSITSN